jgi:lipoprotein-releasing system ATP-binding protein
MTLLSCKKLTKKFGDLTLFEDLDLEIHPSESVAIVGRSGEGKSTLLHLLGLLDTPNSGEIELLGKKATYQNHSLRNKHLGFIFQQFHLLEDYTVLENVLMPAAIARESTKAGSPYHTRALQLLEKVGLKDRQTQSAKLLSGGEKQRVAIARAFLMNPDLILADEPSGNLDKANADSIHQLLLDFARSENKACIIVTHDPQLAKLCAKQFQLSDKKLVPLN